MLSQLCFSKPQTSVAQGPWSYICHIRKFFFELILPFWMYLLRKGAYRDISHIILKHIQ